MTLSPNRYYGALWGCMRVSQEVQRGCRLCAPKARHCYRYCPNWTLAAPMLLVCASVAQPRKGGINDFVFSCRFRKASQASSATQAGAGIMSISGLLLWAGLPLQGLCAPVASKTWLVWPRKDGQNEAQPASNQWRACGGHHEHLQPGFTGSIMVAGAKGMPWNAIGATSSEAAGSWFRWHGEYVANIVRLPTTIIRISGSSSEVGRLR